MPKIVLMPLGNIYNKITITLLILLGFSISSNAQLVITPTATAAALAAKLSGPGVTIIGSSLTCDTLSNGIFVSSSGPITIDSGIVLSTGRAANAAGAEPALTSFSMTEPGDPDITSALLGSTSVSRDACYLVVDFIPKGDTVRFNYQFGSEEYRNSTCGNYNDAFAFFISGPGVSATLPGVNMALVPGTNIPVTVNSINSVIVILLYMLPKGIKTIFGKINISLLHNCYHNDTLYNKKVGSLTGYSPIMQM